MNSDVVDALESKVDSAVDSITNNSKELNKLKENISTVSLDLQQVILTLQHGRSQIRQSTKF